MARLALLFVLACWNIHAQTNSSANDPLIDALIQKGILNQQEADKIQAEVAARSSHPPAVLATSAPERLSPSIKTLQLFGDLRLRYEYRGADNAPGLSPDTFYRERFRYALRTGIRGDLYDDFNYGIRIDTSNNPRSPWDTFGNNTTSGSVTPSDKNTSGIGLGQLFLGWRPTDWSELTVGRMPMPLYTTPMVWDADINPEGAFEKFKLSAAGVDVFASFGQFVYQNPGSATVLPSSDTFLLAWQLGVSQKIGQDLAWKIAPVVYTYLGSGKGNGLDLPYTGEGTNGLNPNYLGGPAFNQNGINDLLVLEIPTEFSFKIPQTPLGALQARVFGDLSFNLEGGNRARTAAMVSGLSHAYPNDIKAYQVGFGVGSAGPLYGPTQGLVYGSTSKRNTWEARVYWQCVEQYALDVNLLDSDFFEGRANMKGLYSAFAYSITDAIVGTVRYGHANPVNNQLGTGGNNLDLPGLNPIRGFNVMQLDLTWRF